MSKETANPITLLIILSTPILECFVFLLTFFERDAIA